MGTAIFVASSFSLVALDPATVSKQAKDGVRGASGVSKGIRDLSSQLSGAQVGITLTTILLGYSTQMALSRMFTSGLARVGLTVALAVTVGTLVAGVLVNTFSMLFGELVPKNTALAEPMKTAGLTVPLLVGFTKAFWPLIKFLQASAHAILRAIGVEPKDELSSARSSAELASLVRRSADEGTLDEKTADLFVRSVAMGDLTAVDVMTDRGRVYVLPNDATASDLIDMVEESGYSRFPITDETGEEFVAISSLRQAVSVPEDRRGEVSILSRSLSQEAPLVPETLGLLPLLVQLREGLQMAVVVDEFGDPSGIVTLEDVVEELVGEVSDEHDRRRRGIKTSPRGGFTMPGTLRPDEVESRTGIPIPTGPYETMGGFIMNELGRIPTAGDVVTTDAATIEVVATQGRRVTRLLVVPFGDEDGEDK